MFHKLKYAILALLLTSTSFAQYSVTKQLGVSGVTAEGGASFTNMLVKTDENGMVDSSLLPDLSGSKLTGWIYVDHENRDSADIEDNIHGSMLKPYKTLEFALQCVDGLSFMPSKIFIVSLSDEELAASFSLYSINTLTLSGAGVVIQGLRTDNTDLNLTLDNVIVENFSAPTVSSAEGVATVYLRHGGAIRNIASQQAKLRIYSDGEVPKYNTNETEYPGVRCFSLVSSDSIGYTADREGVWSWANLSSDNTTVSNALDSLAGMIPKPDNINEPSLLFAWDHQNHKWYWANILGSYMTGSDIEQYINNQNFLHSDVLANYKPWDWLENYLNGTFAQIANLNSQYATKTDLGRYTTTAVLAATYEKKENLINDVLSNAEFGNSVVFENELNGKIDAQISVSAAAGQVATNSAVNAINKTINSSSGDPLDYRNLHSSLVDLIDDRITQQGGGGSPDPAFLYYSDLRPYPPITGYEYIPRDLLSAQTISENFESLGNKVTSVRTSASASNDKYPSEKAVADAIANISGGGSSDLSLRVGALETWITDEEEYLPATYDNGSYRITPDVYFGNLNVRDFTLTGRLVTPSYLLSALLAIDKDVVIDGNSSYAGLGIHELQDEDEYAVFLSSGNTHNLELYGNTSIYGGLETSGDAIFGANADVTDDLTVGGDITVSGAVTVGGDLSIDEGLTVEDDITAQANLSVSSDLTVGGIITSSGNISTSGGISADNSLSVGDDASIAGHASIGGNASITGDVSVGGTLSISGSTSVGQRAAGTIGENSFMHGSSVSASGNSSYSGGRSTSSDGGYSRATGLNSSATKDVAIAEGLNSRAIHDRSFVWNGKYNVQNVTQQAVSSSPVGRDFTFIPSDFGYPQYLSFASLFGLGTDIYNTWKDFGIRVNSKCPALDTYRDANGDFILRITNVGGIKRWSVRVNDSWVHISNTTFPIEVFNSPFEILPDSAYGTVTPVINVGTLESYNSQGKGTFNINPEGGYNGFFVGGQTFDDRFSELSSRSSKPVYKLEDEYSYEIDLSNGNIQWFFNIANDEGRSIILPGSESYELETLTVYITQRWDESLDDDDREWWSMYTFGQDNFLNYPANLPWFDGIGGPNAVFKCEFESPIGCSGWYMINCTKFTLPNDYDYYAY